MLIGVSPAGFEKKSFEIGQVMGSTEESPPVPTQEDIEKLLAIAPSYGIDVMLPGT